MEETPIINNHEDSPQDPPEVRESTSSGVMTVASGILSPYTELDFVPAYIIKNHYAGDFAVKSTANGWWKDQGKVEAFLDALKNGHTVDVACVSIGISENQYRYFKESHPDFLRVRQALRKVNFYIAQETITGDLKSPETAKWFMNKRDKRYKGTEESDDVPQPQINNIDKAIIINNNGVDPRKIQEIAGEVISQFLGELRRERSQRFEGSVDGSVEGVS